jgi:acetyltransferase-like isoleucine patch superfamily enzyme
VTSDLWDTSPLPPGVVVGRDCLFERRLETFAHFRSTRVPALVLGDRVEVYTWTSFSLEPDAFVRVGDDAVLVGAQIMCAERIEIGNRVIVSYGVTIADSDFHPHDPSLRRLDAIASAPGSDLPRPEFVAAPVFVEDDARLGIGAIVLKGVRIGAGARVLPGAVVTADVPSGAVCAGNPGRLIGEAR